MGKFAGSFLSPFGDLVPDLCAALRAVHCDDQLNPARDEQRRVDLVCNRVYDQYWLFSGPDGLSARDVAAEWCIFCVDRHRPGIVGVDVVAAF